jgi:CRP/FNR family transcriptional regulator
MENITTFRVHAKCDSCVIRNTAICAALSVTELKDFSRIARQRLIPAKQVIAIEDDIAFANIIKGVVKLTKTISDGRQQIVGLQFPPDFLGRIYTNETSYFAQAATDVELCAFPKDSFETMLKRHQGLKHRLFENTLDELDSTREWMLLLGRKTAQEKVVSLLLMISKRVPNVGCSHSPNMKFARFQLPLSRTDIADYLGLTIETVSRQITKLKIIGVIDVIDNREIVVPDIDALEAIAGD